MKLIDALPEEDRHAAKAILFVLSMMGYHSLRAPRMLRAMANDLDELDKRDPCDCAVCDSFRKAAVAANN